MHAQTMPYRPGRFVLAAISLLAVPLVAMQVTDEVVWSPGDFLLAGMLLVAPAVLYELAARRPRSLTYRVALLHTLGSLLLLVWGTLAVGFVGEPENSVNVLFLGIPLVVAVGAMVSRLQAAGMAVTMVVAAAALLAAAGVGAGQGEVPVLEVTALGVLFAALLLGPAWLFRVAAGQAPGGPGAEGGLFGSEGLRLQARLSALLALYGVVLLVMMAVVEGEPGAIPLAAVLGGAGWHAVVRRRMRRETR
jgi:hypothetical protein